MNSEEIYNAMQNGDGHTLRVERYRLIDRLLEMFRGLTK